MINVVGDTGGVEGYKDVDFSVLRGPGIGGFAASRGGGGGGVRGGLNKSFTEEGGD